MLLSSGKFIPQPFSDTLYSAAVADENGAIWMASEYIAQTCTLAQFTANNTCGNTRTTNANWSTFVNRVTQ
jgi:hypothetical protein